VEAQPRADTVTFTVELRPGDRIPVPGSPGTVLTVAGISGGKVKIGLEAPPEVVILRAELAGRLVPFRRTGGKRSQ